MYRTRFAIYCNGVTRVHRNTGKLLLFPYRNATNAPACPTKPPPKRKGGFFFYTIGGLALISGVTLVAAKNNPDFREMLVGKFPAADGIIKFVFQEEMSYSDFMAGILLDTKVAFSNATRSLKKLNQTKVPKGGISSEDGESVKDYKAPPSEFESLLDKEQSCKDKFTEIRSIDEGEDVTTVDTITDKSDAAINCDLPSKQSLAELEKEIALSTELAVQGYARAVIGLKDYVNQVHQIIDSSLEKANPGMWNQLKIKAAQKEECLKITNEAATNALRDIEKLQCAINSGIEAPEEVIEQVKYNIKKLREDIAKGQKELQKAMETTDLTDKYWRQIEKARMQFMEEIETLFPGTNICEKKLKIGEADLDLFVLHAYTNVVYYMKEAARLQVLTNNRIAQAMEKVKKDGDHTELHQIELENKINEIKKCMDLEYQRKALLIRAEGDRELRFQLKRQSEIHMEHVNDAVKLREAELERHFQRKLEEMLACEKHEYKMQLAAMLGRLKGMDNALKDRTQADKNAQKAQALWGACQALIAAIKATTPCVPWDKQLRPLNQEVNAIRCASDANDELVQSVINGIPEIAKTRGVYSEDALRERFLKVERVARRLALVPEGGARLPVYLLSYMQSALLLSSENPIPANELQDQRTDFTNLDTYDILARARYWLDRGDFTQTLRYMNLLQGAPRAVAQDWLYETRLMLESQQAAQALMTHAQAQGLLFLE